MKANHNSHNGLQFRYIAVAYEQRYNKWKQITTNKYFVSSVLPLLPMSKDTINESKSQHRWSGGTVPGNGRWSRWIILYISLIITIIVVKILMTVDNGNIIWIYMLHSFFCACSYIWLVQHWLRLSVPSFLGSFMLPCWFLPGQLSCFLRGRVWKKEIKSTTSLN